MLAVILSYFNPCGWTRLRENYVQTLAEYRRQCPPGTVFSGELVYDAETPLVDSQALRIQGDERNRWLWNSEAIKHLVAAQLPQYFTGILCADADIRYLRPDWYDATVEALQTYHVLQNWEYCHWTDRNGNITNRKHSVCKGRKFPDYKSAHPGFNWVWQRDVFDLAGWYTRNPVGSNDAVLCWALFGRGPVSSVVRVVPPYDSFERYRDNYRRLLEQGVNVGYIPGSIVHRWHGDRTNRQYATRDKLLIDAGYQPHHIEQRNGLLRWTDHAPRELINSSKKYFYRRREDG